MSKNYEIYDSYYTVYIYINSEFFLIKTLNAET